MTRDFYLPSEHTATFQKDYAANWVAVKATWTVVTKRAIDPSERTTNPRKYLNIHQAFKRIHNYRWRLYFKLAAYVEEIKHTLPDHTLNSVRRIAECLADLKYSNFAKLMQTQAPCGFAMFCPYCRSRITCRPLFKALIRGKSRYNDVIINFPHTRHVILKRMSIKIKFPRDKFGCQKVMRFANNALTRITRMVQRIRGKNTPRVRGGIITANIVPSGAYWRVYIRGLAWQDVGATDAQLLRVLRQAVRFGNRVKDPAIYDEYVSEPKKQNHKGKPLKTGVILVDETAWATRFFDISAAPPGQLLAILRNKRRWRLQRRFGICHDRTRLKPKSKVSLSELWKGYTISKTQGEDNADKDSDGHRTGRDDSLHGGQAGGPEGSLPGLEGAPAGAGEGQPSVGVLHP